MEEYSSYYLVRLSDLIWAPLCFVVLYIIAYKKRAKYKGTVLYSYYIPAFLWRILFAIIWTFVSQYYFLFADTNHYYQAVLDMHRAVTDDLTYLNDIYFKLKFKDDNRIFNYFLYDQLGLTHFYMYDVKNYMVPRFALPFSLLFGKSYMAISFCLGFFAFGGCWRLFKMFTQLYPHLHKKIAIAFLFLPSLLFWGVGLLKDTICLGAMGYCLYAAYKIFIKRQAGTIDFLIMIGAGLLMYYIKPYIIICLAPAFLLWLFLRARVLIPDRTLRQIATFLFATISMVGAFFMVQSFTSSELASQYSTENILKTVKSQQQVFEKNETGTGSNFEVTDVGSSLSGMILSFPAGIMNTFFRPFPWDVRSPFMVLSFFESFGFLVLTLMCFFQMGIKNFFHTIVSDPVITFCFVFALFFGGLVGMTTINFGALNRYKIPCLPFFAMMLFLVMDKSGKFSTQYIFSKRFF
jgi:hypothetical protein